MSENVQRVLLDCESAAKSRTGKIFARIKRIRGICKKERPCAIIAFMERPSCHAIIATAGLPVSSRIKRKTNIYCY